MTRKTPVKVVQHQCCPGFVAVSPASPAVASNAKVDCQPVCEGGCGGGGGGDGGGGATCVALGVCKPLQPLSSESPSTISPVLTTLLIIFPLVLSAALVWLVMLILRSEPL